MPLPVIANTYQVVFNWTYANAPRDASITLHFKDNLGTQDEDDLEAAIEANVTQAMWTNVIGGARINNLRITKLDGTSAGKDYTQPINAKWGGSGAGGAILQGAQVMSLKSATRGPRGRNRVYLPWIAESEQTDGVLTSANVGTMTTAWVTFVNAMAAQDWWLMAVSAAHNDAHQVVNVTGRSFLATQRRRAR